MSRCVFFLRRRREPALPTGRKCRLATLPGCGKQSHRGRRGGSPAARPVGRRVLPSSAVGPLARVARQMAPLPRAPVTVGTSRCLPGLAADLLSEAELPLGKGEGIFTVTPHGSLRGEGVREKSTVNTHSSASRGSRERRRVPKRGW